MALDTPRGQPNMHVNMAGPAATQGSAFFISECIVTVYTKPYLAIPEQLALLKKRGMTIENEDDASDHLSSIGYYRLSAYWYPFRTIQYNENRNRIVLDFFKEGTHFSTVLQLYKFDKSLRSIMLEGLEAIEVSLRTQIALEIGQHSPWAHREAHLLDGHFANRPNGSGHTRHADWLERLDEKARNSKEEFAEHFRRKYPDSNMPIWIAVELLDFGPLSHLLSGLKWSHLKNIALKYRIVDPQILRSWIRSLTFVRNVCAHHARLWNKPLVDQPKLPKQGQLHVLEHINEAPHKNTRLYASCATLQYMLKAVATQPEWPTQLVETMRQFPEMPHLSLADAGFPDHWQDSPLWN